ncbi:MAG: hypothetical protein WC256_04535 [Desulfurivibrionaceae bacterium]|jgi:uncharacterized protein YggU (UPF0235/DUF167 family)
MNHPCDLTYLREQADGDSVSLFFSKLFKIPRAAVTLASGEVSRDKRLFLQESR